MRLRRIEEYNWEGDLVWEFDYRTDRYAQHHDIQPLPNGNILMLAIERKSIQRTNPVSLWDRS